MPYLTGSIAHLSSLSLALALTSLSVCGCDLPASCNCPSGGGYTTVAVPAAQSSPIAAASTNQPCTISGFSDESVSVSTYKGGGCQVLVQLADGDTYTFSVQFEQETIHGACDCGVIRVVGGTPAPTLTDAG